MKKQEFYNIKRLPRKLKKSLNKFNETYELGFDNPYHLLYNNNTKLWA